VTRCREAERELRICEEDRSPGEVEVDPPPPTALRSHLDGLS
jgi:hypothetical protein